MVGTLKIDVARVIGYKKYFNKINKQKLDSLKLEYKGIPIDIKSEDINTWKYTGLNNTDFILNLDLPD